MISIREINELVGGNLPHSYQTTGVSHGTEDSDVVSAVNKLLSAITSDPELDQLVRQLPDVFMQEIYDHGVLAAAAMSYIREVAEVEGIRLTPREVQDYARGIIDDFWLARIWDEPATTNPSTALVP